MEMKGPQSDIIQINGSEEASGTQLRLMEVNVPQSGI